MIECPLCLSKTNSEIKYNLIRCLECDLVFKTEIVSSKKESERYLEHNNDINDEGYLSYLEKLLKIIQKNEAINSETKMLDFGSGPTKGLEALVKKRGLSVDVTSYDPYFFKLDLENHKNTFDIIFASECFEHFNRPFKTISELCALLKAKGMLAVGTYLHSEATNFNTWWYLKDHTHIVFYSLKTVEFIQQKFSLKLIHNDETHLIFRKND